MRAVISDTLCLSAINPAPVLRVPGVAVERPSVAECFMCPCPRRPSVAPSNPKQASVTTRSAMIGVAVPRDRRVRCRRTSERVIREAAEDAVEEATPAMGHNGDRMAELLSRDLRTCGGARVHDPPRTPCLHDAADADVDAEGSVMPVRTDADADNKSTASTEQHRRHRQCSQRLSQAENRTAIRRPLLARRQLHRLGDLFLLGVCLLSVLSPTMSAPASPSHQRPKWINPCGLGSSDDIDSELVDLGLRLNDQELLSQIVVQAKNALMHADLFKDDYVKNTFNLDFQQHHDSWKKNHYEWLPSETDIPKKLGEPIPAQHLQALELDQALKDSYTYMQKMAVGLEQVVWDQNREHGDFHKEFMDTEYKLRATLCEIQVAILERNVMQHEDVTRALMSAEFRRMENASYRNLRDWLIFRDYMNGLEYIIEVFEFFKRKLTS